MCLRDQEILGDPASWNKVANIYISSFKIVISYTEYVFDAILCLYFFKVLALILDDDLRGELTAIMPTKKNSTERWNAMNDHISSYLEKRNKERNKPRPKTSMSILHEIMIQYAYPRLDIAVTKGLNHLLKSPFCVHPKTGK